MNIKAISGAVTPTATKSDYTMRYSEKQLEALELYFNGIDLYTIHSVTGLSMSYLVENFGEPEYDEEELFENMSL